MLKPCTLSHSSSNTYIHLVCPFFPPFIHPHLPPQKRSDSNSGSIHPNIQKMNGSRIKCQNKAKSHLNAMCHKDVIPTFIWKGSQENFIWTAPIVVALPCKQGGGVIDARSPKFDFYMAFPTARTLLMNASSVPTAPRLPRQPRTSRTSFLPP